MGSNHFDDHGNAIMVDVTEKEETCRIAIAKGLIAVNEAAWEAIIHKSAKKGDVLLVAQVASITALKKTYELIPMCHIVPLTHASVTFALHEEQREVEVTCTVKCTAKTGVEMEALTGVSVALLTIYDMCKAYDKAMTMKGICLEEKKGGKSGDYKRTT